jgi:hypothetical protein
LFLCGRGRKHSKGNLIKAFSVRPQTKFTAAVVAAGVVSAASLGGVSENRSLPVLNIDVAKASVITDALVGFGDAVNGVASGLALASDAGSSLPFDAFTALAIAAQNPSLGPSLLSWLIQRYTNPSDNYLPDTYPRDIKEFSIEPLAALLPVGSDLIINAVNQISDAINDALSVLPSSDPGVLATDEFWASDIGRTVSAVNFAVTAPAWLLYSTAFYLGYLPVNLEATFESALQSPSEIPGLVSNLVYGLLSPAPPPSPDGSLFGDLLFYTSRPFTTLPGPIGELANNTVNAITDGVNGLLAQLPPPVSPTPFPSALATAEVADVQVEPNSVPDASLAVANASTLSSTDPVENKVEAVDSTENTPPATPQDPAPTADDVDQDATPPADKDVPDVKPDKPAVDPAKLAVDPAKPAADPVKSGNKVKPGEKFGNQAKGETGKGETGKGEGSGNGTTATTPGTVDATPGDTDPTGTPAGPTAGADHSDPSEGSGAAA